MIVIIGFIFNVLIWQNRKLAILCSSTLPQIILKFSWHMKSQSLGAVEIDATFLLQEVGRIMGKSLMGFRTHHPQIWRLGIVFQAEGI